MAVRAHRQARHRRASLPPVGHVIRHGGCSFQNFVYRLYVPARDDPIEPLETDGPRGHSPSRLIGDPSPNREQPAEKYEEGSLFTSSSVVDVPVDAPLSAGAEYIEVYRDSDKPRRASIVRTSALLAGATVISRVTGLIAKIALAAALGAGVVNNSYTLANTLPNIVFELLIGGVLASVAIPLITRAQYSDSDDGVMYTQRLLTLMIVGLAGATVLAVALAPLLTRLYLDSSSNAVDIHLATSLARLLLPQIFFYGLAAMFGAILNSRDKFAANAWAPVLNNIVVIGVATWFLLRHLDGPPAQFSRNDILVLGIGTTLGICAQAGVLIPALRRSGFRFCWRWGWDRRLSEAGGLVCWSIAYVFVSQIGVVVTTRIASLEGISGGVVIFQMASLLFQMPYGILGVAVLTAIMPRMSRHAAAGQLEEIKHDVSQASRLSAVTLLPVSAALVVLGTPISVVLFRHGQVGVDSAVLIGITLSSMAIGLYPLAVTLIQMRVFYALKDGKVPVAINLIMVTVRLPLLFFSSTLPSEFVIPGLGASTAVSYIIGALVGQLWLRKRLGKFETAVAAGTVSKMYAASIGAGVVAFATIHLLIGWRITSFVEAVVVCGLAIGAGLLALAGLAIVLKVDEIQAVKLRIFPPKKRGVAESAD